MSVAADVREYEGGGSYISENNGRVVGAEQLNKLLTGKDPTTRSRKAGYGDLSAFSQM
jgi:hypothetical protein